MHQHKECEHNILYCSKCDVCYCSKCNKEWTYFTLSVPTVWYDTNTYIDNKPYYSNNFPNGELKPYPYTEYPTITISHSHEG